MPKLFYTLIGVLGACAAAVWIVPAWISTGIYTAGLSAKRLVTR